MTNITNPNKIELMAKTEETKYKALKLSIAKVDMECAELIKKLRATPLFALELIRERIALMIGKYFSTPNQDLIYKIKSGTVEIVASTKIVKHGALKSDTLELNGKKTYIVKLEITKYEKTGQFIETNYKIVSEELPKDVDKWLYMGNHEISLSEAKDYLTKALNAEKKALEARIKEINSIIK